MSGAGRRVGSTNSFKSTRNQTTAQKRAQNEKAQAKKKANRKAKAEAKTAADRKKNDAIWRSFNAGPNDQLQTGNNNPTGPAPAQQTPEIGLPVNNGGDEDASSSSGSDEPVVITHQVIDPITNSQSAIATNIVPNFDYNEDEAGSDDGIGDDDDMPDDVDGVQQLFLKTVVERLAKELNPKNKNTVCTWLLNFLNENNWWIKQFNARKIAKKLNLPLAPKALYRDVYVWLPDVSGLQMR